MTLPNERFSWYVTADTPRFVRLGTDEMVYHTKHRKMLNIATSLYPKIIYDVGMGNIKRHKQPRTKAVTNQNVSVGVEFKKPPVW
jgi:hypothetical protein